MDGDKEGFRINVNMVVFIVTVVDNRVENIQNPISSNSVRRHIDNIGRTDGLYERIISRRPINPEEEGLRDEGIVETVGITVVVEVINLDTTHKEVTKVRNVITIIKAVAKENFIVLRQDVEDV